jgi:hypothetical protein
MGRKKLHLFLCDKIISEIRDLSLRSYRGIFDKARMHKYIYNHTISYMKFKLKLLQIKCHVLEFIKYEAQKL